MEALKTLFIQKLILQVDKLFFQSQSWSGLTSWKENEIVF